MRLVLRSAVVPVYILLCIFLGGSGQGIWGVAALQFLAILIIGWSLLARNRLPLTRSAKILFVIAGVTILLLVVQIIPLPPAAWTAIPGRGHVVEGFELLGLSPPWQPISLTPYDTAATILTLIPPLAVLVAMLVAGAYRASWIAIALLAGTFAAVLLGALQVASADPLQSPWYLYRWTNYGVATGFFANSNHMAMLLLVTVPLLFALIAELRSQSKNPRFGSAVMLLAVSGILVLLVGIFLNRSLAVLLLVVPIVIISATLLMPHRLRLRGPVIAVALVSIPAILAVYLTPLYDRLLMSNVTSFESRQMMWSDTVSAIQDHGLLGSGAGSFPRVYRQYEDYAEVTRTFINHAHNDYLEVTLEAGVPGVLLLLAFLLWWGGRAVPIWRTAAVDRYAVAATIASAAMLVHSLVDYPLRTTTLSAIMAACLALMARPRPRDGTELEDLWLITRHATV